METVVERLRSIGAPVLLIVLAILLSHGGWTDKAHAAEPDAPMELAQSSQTAGDLLAILKDVPGLASIPVTGVKKEGNATSATLKLRGRTMTLVGFKVGSTPLAALVPSDFALTDIVPVPRGTPMDGVKFKDMAFVYMPKGRKPAQASVSSFPQSVRTALSHVGTKVLLNDGLNLFGEADFNSSQAIRQVLSAVGHTQLKLPLSGTFPPDLFKFDPKKASQKIKDDLLKSLKLDLALPKLKIPGMPDIVSVDNARLAVVGREVKGRLKVFAGVTGGLDVGLANKKHRFSFGILAADPGKQFQPKITAESKDTVHLPFFQPLDVTGLNLVADKKGGKWDTTINGKAKLKGKEVDVSVHHDPKAGNTALIKAKMRLADLLPSGTSIPGVTDVEFDALTFSKHSLQVVGKIRGLDTTVEAFKHQGKTYVAVSNPHALKFSSLVPQAKGTPLDAGTFQHMTYVWAPKGGAANNLKPADLPADAAFNAKQVVKTINLKPGLNVIGRMDIKQNSDIHKVLTAVGIHKDWLPLVGNLSPKLFHKNPSTAIKNEILDGLDIKANLPALKIPEVDKFLTFTGGNLEIAGKTPDGKRGLDIGVSGDANLKVKRDRVAFKVDIEKTKRELSFSGSTEKPWVRPLGIHWLTLNGLSLTIDKKKGAYDIDIVAKTKVGASTVDVSVDVHEKGGSVTDAFFEMDGPLKLSDIPLVREIPHSSHFEINTVKVSEHGIEAKTDFGGKKDLDVYLFSGSGWNLLIRQDDFTVTELLPPLKSTPLKHIVLSEAAVVISKDGLSGNLSSFSPIAQDALKDIYGAGAAHVDVESGLNLIAAFEHKKSKGGLSDAMKRLGLSEERVILTGDIGGLFGGATKFDVEVDLSAHSGAKNQPKWMTAKPGVTAVFSMIATESAGQFDVEIGIGADITAKVHGTELDFTAKTALEFEDEKIDVKIVADLKDKKGWKKPFGIPGFTLYEVGFDLGIAEDGAIHLGFDGDIKVSGSEYKIAADADLLPEALGAPPGHCLHRLGRQGRHVLP